MHGWIVGRKHNEAAVCPCYCGIHKRIGGNVEADVFHGRHGPGAGKSRADDDLKGDLFIGRPLAAPAQLGKGFKDFG